MLDGGAAVLDLDRAAVARPGRAGGGARRARAEACRRACAAAAGRSIPPLSVIAFVFGRARGRTRERAGAHLSRAVRGARARGARARLARVGRAPRARPLRRCSCCRCSRWRGSIAAAWRARRRRSCSRRSAAWRSACCSPRSRRRAGWPRGSSRWPLADTALVVSDLLQRPNNALNAAHPVAGLPRLQSAVLRLGGDGLRRPVHRRRARGAARGHGRPLAAAARRGAHRDARAGLRPAVLPRRRAAGDGAGGARADR